MGAATDYVYLLHLSLDYCDHGSDLGPGPMTLTFASALWPLGASQFSQGCTKHACTYDAFTVAGRGDDKLVDAALYDVVAGFNNDASGASCRTSCAHCGRRLSK